MQTKNVSFEQLADIMAFRIIVADIAQCYQALGLLHGRYQVLPQRFKDYISVPKPNGYRSLHTGVIGPLGPSPRACIAATISASGPSGTW